MKDREIGKSLMMIQNHITRAMGEMESDKVIPRGQGRVLRFIYYSSNQDLSQKDIETEFNLRRSSATEILQKLEMSGMIERISDQQDKRIKKIQITKKGEESVELISKNIQKMEEILHQGISISELEVFFSVLDKMTSNLIEEREEEK